MSLRSVDITKVKRLSLRDTKLPAPERRAPESRVEPSPKQGSPKPPIQRERPPTDEDIAYSKLAAINPLIEDLVESLDLVSITTGVRMRKVELREDTEPPTEPEVDPQGGDKAKLISLAQRLIEGENSYTKEEVVERLRADTNMSLERAERGFNSMLQAGAIEPTPGGSYYLTGSTPF